MEYGVAVIITPIIRFYHYLRSRITGSEPVRQYEQQEDTDSQHEVVNGADDNRAIELDKKRTWTNCPDFAVEIKVNKQAITEMSNRMDKLFKMVEKISNHHGQIKQRSNKTQKL